jgi:hypothetical protein
MLPKAIAVAMAVGAWLPPIVVRDTPGIKELKICLYK